MILEHGGRHFFAGTLLALHAFFSNGCSTDVLSTTANYTVSGSGTHVTFSPSVEQSVAIGSTLTYTVTPDTGYSTSTSVGGTCASGSWNANSYTTGVIAADCTVSFSASIQTYTATPSADSHTTVSPSSAQAINYGGTATFTLTADTGYTLSSAVGGTCPGGSLSGSTYTTGAITGDCTVIFSSNLITLTVTPSGDGHTTVSPSAAQTVNYGATQSFSLTPDSGYGLRPFATGTCPNGSFSGSTYTTGIIISDCGVSFSSTNDSLATNLLALWHLDGTAGSIANGSTLSDSWGTYTGTTVTSGSNLSYATGKFGTGVVEASSTAKVSFGTSFGNFGTSDFTIAFWIKTSASGIQQFINKRTICGHQSMFNIAMNSGKFTFEVDQNTSGTNYIGITTTLTYNDGNWHHVAMVRSTKNATIYVDGTSVKTGSASGTANISSTVDFEIGNLPCTSQPLVGTIDEIGVWTRALTDTEISTLAAASSALNP
ncbi:MAG: hypothetical protein HYR96_03080 [Deltaproteobacteria bacterium]|nr:hypothetical protein [Deltaproteobacteria bacterium]